MLRARPRPACHGPCLLTCSTCSPQRRHQLPQASQHPVGPGAPQDSVGICQEPGDPGDTHTQPATPAAAGLQGVLKVLRTPGSSVGTGRGKQVLLMLQMRPQSQGTVPADGSGLLGKWPAGMPDMGFSSESPA